MIRRAFKLPLENAGKLLQDQRLNANLTGLVCAPFFWVHLEENSPNTSKLFDRIGCLERYSVSPGERLIPIGKRLPVDTLPTGDWKPLSALLSPKADDTALPARPSAPQTFELVERIEPATPNALLTSIHKLKEFAEIAPSFRLTPLSFATCSDSRVLIVGSPLPSVIGEAIFIENNIALPIRKTLSHPAVEGLIRTALGLRGNDLALFSADSACEVIDCDHFKPGSRSAIRLTSISIE